MYDYVGDMTLADRSGGCGTSTKVFNISGTRRHGYREALRWNR